MNAGRVYYAFEREGNVGAVEVNEGLPLLWALDFNVDPMCSVVAQVEGGRVNVIDEIVGRSSTYTTRTSPCRCSRTSRKNPVA